MDESVQKKNNPWKVWKTISEKVGNFQGRLILEALYFSIFLIPSVIMTVFSDKLRIKHPPETWDDKERQNITNIEEAKEQ